MSSNRKSVVTAILRNFSSSNNNSEWEIYDDDRIENLLEWFIPSLYVNGNSKENEGYVSINFTHKFGSSEDYAYYKLTEIRCYVSVVDVAGNKRFTQSVVCVVDNISPLNFTRGFDFGLERYINRETLLNDPHELLPGECLTICMNVEFIYHYSDWTTRNKELNLETFTDEDGRVWIFLDREFGRDLCKVSQYFRSVSDTPMIESKIRRVRIEKDEEEIFERIFCIFYEKRQFDVTSMREISDLYRVADKYDIQSVIETCRQIINAVLCAAAAENPKCENVDECVSEILNLADDYRDDEIKEAVETYLESKENFGTDESAFGQYLTDTLYTEWKCEFVRIEIVGMPGNFAKFQLPLYFKLKKTVNLEFQFYQ